MKKNCLVIAVAALALGATAGPAYSQGRWHRIAPGASDHFYLATGTLLGSEDSVRATLKWVLGPLSYQVNQVAVDCTGGRSRVLRSAHHRMDARSGTAAAVVLDSTPRAWHAYPGGSDGALVIAALCQRARDHVQ